MTSGAPIMSSQKIGPSSLVSRTRCCTGALGSSDSMLPTTGFFGGCGIGFNLLGDAIVEVSPAALIRLHRYCLRQTRSACARERSDEAIHLVCRAMDCFASLAMTTRHLSSTKSLFTPFDQFGADLVRLFL